jgi:hypothetical protein
LSSETRPSFEWLEDSTAAARADQIAAELGEQGLDTTVDEFAPGVFLVEARGTDPPAHQMVFVHGAPWHGASLAAVLRNNYAAVSDFEDTEPPTWVAFVGPEPLPFALEYLYGSNWWGPLERELYRAFADPSLDPTSPPPFIEAAEAVLERFGVSMRGDRFATLDELLASLPRPEDLGTTYQPVATIVAIGLMMGDDLESRYSRLRWVPGEALMARYFALRVSEDEAIRPIDFVMEAYREPLDHPIRGYAELVSLRATIE